MLCLGACLLIWRILKKPPLEKSHDSKYSKYASPKHLQIYHSFLHVYINVKIAGDVYLIIKTSPTVSADLVSTGGSGVNSYIDLDDRPDGVIDTTVIPATTTGGEFTPNNDNDNKADNLL
jgi:hypothetical protein